MKSVRVPTLTRFLTDNLSELHRPIKTSKEFLVGSISPSIVGSLLPNPTFSLGFGSVEIYVCLHAIELGKRSIPVEEKRITELLEEIVFNTAYINTKVANAIEETEDLLKDVLAVLGKR